MVSCGKIRQWHSLGKILPTPMLLLLFVDKIEGKDKTMVCTAAKAADMQWNKTSTVVIPRV